MLQDLFAKMDPEHFQHRPLDLAYHPVRITSAPARHDTHHIFKQEYILHFGHFGHHDILAPQILYLLRSAAVTVHYAVTVQMVYLPHITERARGLDNLVTGAERPHSMGRKNQRIQLRVYTMGGITLYKQHRAACAGQSCKQFVRHTSLRKSLIVPGHSTCVMTLDPYTEIAGTGIDKLCIRRIVDKSTVWAQPLYGIPQIMQHGRMDKHRRRVDKYNPVAWRIQHCRHIIQHCFLTGRKFDCRYQIVSAGGGKQESTLFAHYFVTWENILPYLYQPVQLGRLQPDIRSIDNTRAFYRKKISEFILEQQGA